MAHYLETYVISLIKTIVATPVGENFTSKDIALRAGSPDHAATSILSPRNRPTCVTAVGTAPGKGAQVLWQRTYSPTEIALSQTIEIINTGGSPDPRPGACATCHFGTNENTGCPDVEVYQATYSQHRRTRIDEPYAQLLGQVHYTPTESFKLRPSPSPLRQK